MDWGRMSESSTRTSGSTTAFSEIEADWPSKGWIWPTYREVRGGPDGMRSGGKWVIYSTSSSMYMVREIVKGLNDDQVKAVESIGFGSILHFNQFDINMELLSWLIERFDASKKILNVHGYNLEITPRDVEYILGFKSHGMQLMVSTLGVDQKIEKELNIDVIGNQIGLVNLRRNIQQLDSSGAEFKVKFVLYLIGRLLAPPIGYGISRTLIPAVAKVDLLEMINWSKYILDELANGIANRVEKPFPEVGGCMVFLMIFYLEHVNLRRCKPIPTSMRPMPRIWYWVETDLKFRIIELQGAGLFDGNEVDVIVAERVVDRKLYDEEKAEKDSADQLTANALRGVQIAMMKLGGQQEELEAKMFRLETKINVNHRILLSIVAAINEGKWCSIDRDIVDEMESGIGKTMAPKMTCMRNPVTPKKVGESNDKRQEGKMAAKEIENKSGYLETNYHNPITPPKLGKGCDTVCEKIYDVDDMLSLPRRIPEVKPAKWEPKSTKRRDDIRANTAVAIAASMSSCNNVVMTEKCKGKRGRNELKEQRLSPFEIGTMVGKRRKHGKKAHNQIKQTSESSQENSERINRIFDYIVDDSMPRSSIIVHILSHTASREAMQILLPEGWLSSEVISCYVSMLTRRARKDIVETSYPVWYLPVDFEVVALDFNKCDDVLYRAFLTGDRFGGPIDECERICIPFNWESFHWLLIVADLTSGTVFLLDSLPAKNELENNLRLAMAKKLWGRLQMALFVGMDGRKAHRIFTDFIIDAPDWCPHQPNLCDCGIYVLKFMEKCQFLGPNLQLQFDSVVERKKVAVRLFLDDGNQFKGRGLRVMGMLGIETCGINL